jgi:hypothetical protein
MRRLAPRHAVVLDLGEEAIACRVTAVDGDEATLTPVSAADAGYIPSLGRAASLAFEAGGERVRVAGAVRRGRRAGLLRFAAGAGDDLPPRRRAPRMTAALAVALTPLAPGGAPAGPARRLLTADVSLGGLGVDVGRWTLAPGAPLAFTLELPTGPPIEGTARVLRLEDGIAGLELAHVAPADRARLAAYLIAVRSPG